MIEQLTDALRSAPPTAEPAAAAPHSREGVLRSLLSRLTGLFTRTA